MAKSVHIAHKVCRLKPDYFLGVETKINGNVHFIDEETIMYPIGRVFLFHNIQNDVQSYMKIPDSSKTITSLVLSPNINFVAVVEKGGRPTISVFNIKTHHRVVMLGIPSTIACTSECFEFVSFTSGSENIVAVTGPPDWLMIYYNISGLVESYTSALGEIPPLSATSITNVACNPVDPTILCIVGFGLFRFISWTDGAWVQYGFNSASKLQITDVCWVTDDAVIAGTRCGRLVVVEYGDIRGVYRANLVTQIIISKDNDHRIDLDSKSIPKGYKFGVYQVSGLRAFSSGFAYSYTRSTVVVFEASNSYTWIRKNIFITVEPIRTVSNMKNEDHIKYVSVSPLGKKLACTTGRKEIYYSEILMQQDVGKSDVKYFKKILSGYHLGRVSSIDTCLWKPLLMSVGKDDGFCRIWNYKTKKVVFSQTYPDDKIYSCAFHPMGWYCLLGFKHQLKMFMLMVDELKPLRLFRIKMCNLVSFSHQGHLFAASNSSKRTIEVYCCVSFEKLWDFNCFNNPVIAIHFGPKDNFLYTTDPDGSINFWDLQTGEDINTKIYLDSPNYDVACSKNGKVYFVGTDGNLKEISQEKLVSYKLGQRTLYAIALGEAEEALFVGGESCSIVSIKFPLTETVVSQEFKMHSSPIKKILVKNNDSILISLDSRGLIGFWRIKPPLGTRFSQSKYIPELTEVVVSISKLAEEDETIEKQQINIERKSYQHNYIIQHLQNVKSKDIENLTKDYLSQIGNLKRTMKANEKFHSTQTSTFQQIFEERTKYYISELDKQSKLFESELMMEYIKSDALKGQTIVFINDVRQYIKISKAATQQIFELYDSFVNMKIKDIKSDTLELKYRRKSLLQKFSRETYNFEKFINDCIDQYSGYHERRLTKLGKRKEYLKDEILFLIKKSSFLEDKIKTFYGSGMKIFKHLDEMRITSRIFKTKVKSLQMTLDAVESQARKKDELILSVRKLLKSDVHEQMEKTERFENLKLVLKPALDAELKHCRETEENLQHNLLVQRSKIISVGLCISAVEKQIKEVVKKKNRTSGDVDVKKYLEEVKADLNLANKVSDNRVELKNVLMSLYKKYINPKATEESIENICIEGDVPKINKGRNDAVDETGLEDVVECYQMDEMLRKGEACLKDQIWRMRKSTPSRPALLVGYKTKSAPTTRILSIVKEINTYRYRVAEALEKLAAASKKTDDYSCD